MKFKQYINNRGKVKIIFTVCDSNDQIYIINKYYKSCNITRVFNNSANTSEYLLYLYFYI